MLVESRGKIEGLKDIYVCEDQVVVFHFKDSDSAQAAAESCLPKIQHGRSSLLLSHVVPKGIDQNRCLSLRVNESSPLKIKSRDVLIHRAALFILNKSFSRPEPITFNCDVSILSVRLADLRG